MRGVAITVAAGTLVLGYLVGRVQPLKRTRRRAWLGVAAGTPTYRQAVAYTVLHPVETAPMLAKHLLFRATGSSRFAPKRRRVAPVPVSPWVTGQAERQHAQVASIAAALDAETAELRDEPFEELARRLVVDHDLRAVEGDVPVEQHIEALTAALRAEATPPRDETTTQIAQRLVARGVRAPSPS